jgi:hypothetical protein
MNLKLKENLIKKENELSSLEDIQKTAFYLSNDICIFLGELMEDLNVSSYVFRTGMERALARVLNSLLHRPQNVLMYPDSIPGFTLMIFRKNKENVNNLESGGKLANVPRSPVDEIKEISVIETVIGKFFDKNSQKVLVIENNDLLFALFPVADTKKNLVAMDLYIPF